MNSVSAGSPTRRRLPLLAALWFAAVALLMATASSASALSLGLQWNGNPDQAASEAELENVQRSGAAYFRMEIHRGRSFESYETLFDRAAKRGITILPQLDEGHIYPAPGSDGKYGGWGIWAREIVQAFGAGGWFWTGKPYAKPVTTWEVWNEPNLAENNAGGVVNPKAFGDFFVFTSNEIHAVQPGAQVLVGGLYLGHWSEPEMESYVSGLYQAPGMASAVDGFGIHPYGFTQGQQIAEFASETINFRTVLNRRAQGSSKPIWITELGWPVPENEAQETAFAPKGVSAPAQAELLRQSLNWTKSNANGLFIQGLIWYAGVDNGDYETWQYRCGLRDSKGNYRQSWWEFQQQAGAPIWPVWSAWPSENLGGGFTSDPTIASQGPGQLNVFARGSDGALWHRWYSGGAWSGWQSLGGNLTSGPGAVSWGPNRIDVVARGTDNAVWHWAWNGSGWSLESLGGSVASDPDISSLGPGYLDLFVRGGNSLWHRSYSGSWGPWADQGGVMTSGPGTVSWSNTRTDVVYLTNNGSINHTFWSP